MNPVRKIQNLEKMQYLKNRLLILTASSALILFMLFSVTIFFQDRILSLLFPKPLTYAANLTWDGGGATNNWSEAANWSTNTLPGGGDTAIFDGTSSKNVTIDTSISVGGIDIKAGYTGTITQAKGVNISFGFWGYTQAAGTFVGGDGNFSVVRNTTTTGSAFTLTGGTFTPPLGTFSFEADFTISGGTYNGDGKTVTFNGLDFVDNSILTCSGTLPGIVFIDKSGQNADFTLSSGCSITVTIIQSNGNVTNNGTITHTGTVFDLNDVASAFAKDGGGFYNNAGATIIFAGTEIFLEGDFTQAGTFDLTGKTITFDGVDFFDGSDIVCNGNLGGSVIIMKGTNATTTVSEGCIATVEKIQTAGSLINSGTINHTGTIFEIINTGVGDATTGDLINNASGTITFAGTEIFIEGDFTQNGTFNLTGKTITFGGADGTDNSTIACTGSLGGSLIFAKGGGNGDITVASGCTVEVSQITTTGTVTNNGTLNFTGTIFDINNSSINAIKGNLINNSTINMGGCKQINIEGDFIQSGTFDLSTTTVISDGPDGNDDTTFVSNSPIGAIIVSKNGHPSFSGAFLLGSDVTVHDFTVNNTAGGNPSSPFTLTITGNLSLSSTRTFGIALNFGGTNEIIKLAGTTDQSIFHDFININSPIVVDKASGSVNLISSLATNSSLDIVNGSFNMEDFSLSLGGSLAISDILYQGDGNLSALGVTVNSSGSWVNSSTGDVTLGTGGINNLGFISLNGTSVINLDGANNNFASPPTSDSGWTDSGKFAKALAFDGINDFVSIANPGLPTRDYTYEAWVFHDDIGSASEAVFMAPDGSGNNEFLVMINTSNQIEVYTPNALAVTSSTSVPIGQWSHLVVTRSGSTISIYINGIQDPTTGSVADTLNFGSCALNIGRDIDPGSCTSGAGNFFDGKIDDVRIYHYARLAAQVTEDMNGSDPGISVSAYWKFDEGVDNTCSGGVNDVCNSANTLGACQSGVDEVLIRSSVTGTQRSWEGTGTFQLYDINVADQAGSAILTAQGSTNSGNNGSNWTFSDSCPASQQTPSLPTPILHVDICAVPTSTPTPTPTPTPTLSCGFSGPTTLMAGEVGRYSSTSGGTITNFFWRVPTGNIASGVASTFDFGSLDPGLHNITLNVFGPAGEMACESNIEVLAQPITPSPTPTASPTASPTATPSATLTPTLTPILTPTPLPTPILECSFTGPTSLVVGQTGTYTSTSTGTISSYFWSASGGSPLSGLNPTFNWSSSNIGTFTITLTITGPGGERACNTQVNITAPPAGGIAPTPTPVVTTVVVPQAPPVTGRGKE